MSTVDSEKHQAGARGPRRQRVHAIPPRTPRRRKPTGSNRARYLSLLNLLFGLEPVVGLDCLVLAEGRTDPRRESGIITLRRLVPPHSRLTMPCFLLLVILLFPRVALVLMWIFSTYLQRAFHGGLVLPVLGFIFLPLTTIVYAWELNSGMPTEGINLLWLLVAVIIDVGGLGGGAHRQSRR